MTTNERVEEAGYSVTSRPNAKVKSLAQMYLNDHRDILKGMRLPTPSLHFISGRLGDGHLARSFVPFSDFNEEAPGILISSQAILQSAKRHPSVGLDTVIESTLLHEYGHLWAHKKYGEADRGWRLGSEIPLSVEEDAVEQFAYMTWRTGDWQAAFSHLRKTLQSR